jgi:hypothetical protein
VRPELAVGEEIRSGLHGCDYTRQPVGRPREKPALSCSYARIKRSLPVKDGLIERKRSVPIGFA